LMVNQALHREPLYPQPWPLWPYASFLHQLHLLYHSKSTSQNVRGQTEIAPIKSPHLRILTISYLDQDLSDMHNSHTYINLKLQQVITVKTPFK
jgi:hypothetical protein